MRHISKDVAQTCLELLSQVRLSPTEGNADTLWAKARQAVEELNNVMEEPALVEASGNDADGLVSTNWTTV